MVSISYIVKYQGLSFCLQNSDSTAILRRLVSINGKSAKSLWVGTVISLSLFKIPSVSKSFTQAIDDHSVLVFFSRQIFLYTGGHKYISINGFIHVFFFFNPLMGKQKRITMLSSQYFDSGLSFTSHARNIYSTEISEPSPVTQSFINTPGQKVSPLAVLQADPVCRALSPGIWSSLDLRRQQNLKKLKRNTGKRQNRELKREDGDGTFLQVQWLRC